jgi:small multidrug resistance family-3 protein
LEILRSFWRTLRSGGSLWLGILGGVILVIYGILPTFQSASFGRVYAAYGGIFIALSILWGWQVDRVAPDRYELIGGLITLIGVGVIMYWPRS